MTYPYAQFPPPQPSQPPVQSWWAKQTSGARAAIVMGGIVAVIGIVAIIGLIAVAASGHSASWKQGYNTGDAAAGEAVYNAVEALPGGATTSCQGNLFYAKTYHIAPASDEDFMDGCRAAFAKHGMKSW
jgi:hypothetical protein